MKDNIKNKITEHLKISSFDKEKNKKTIILDKRETINNNIQIKNDKRK